jgi:hypothetical protein
MYFCDFSAKHLHTSLECPETLCHKAFQPREVFCKHLTQHLKNTSLCSSVYNKQKNEMYSEVLGEVFNKHLTHRKPFAHKAFGPVG